MSPSNEGAPIAALLVLDSLVPGGTERSTVDLLPHLAELGVTPQVAVLHDRPGLQDEVRAGGFPLHVLQADRGRIGWVRQLRSLLASTQPDLVHTSLFEADICGRIAAASHRVPAVSTMPTERYGQAHLHAPHLRTAKVRAAQALDVATVRLARRLHAVSPHVADAMARHLRYPRHRIDIVPRGRPRRLAQRTPDRAEGRRLLGLPDGQPAVVALARHEHAKGLDRLIVAWPRVLVGAPSARLFIAGRDGAETLALERLRRELGIEQTVSFLGHRDDVDLLLDGADLFVLPSRREGMPGALLEAMAAGVPAVVSDIGQIHDVVERDQAMIVDAGDPTKLAEAVVEALHHRPESQRRAEAARQRFLRDFTLEATAEGMVAFYRRSLGMAERTAADTEARRS